MVECEYIGRDDCPTYKGLTFLKEIYCDPDICWYPKSLEDKLNKSEEELGTKVDIKVLGEYFQ